MRIGRASRRAWIVRSSVHHTLPKLLLYHYAFTSVQALPHQVLELLDLEEIIALLVESAQGAVAFAIQWYGNAAAPTAHLSAIEVGETLGWH